MNTFKDFLNEKVNYMNLNQLKKQLKKDYGSKASSLKIVKIKGGVSIQTPSGQELERYNNVPKLGYTVVENALDEAKKVIAQVELWNGKKMKKSFKNQSAAEKFIKKMQDQEDVRGYNMYAESAQLEESRGDLMKNAEYLKLINQAMSAMPGSPKQKGIIKKINVIRKKAGFKPLDEADGCWDGFKKVGMKKKGDKLVPNCIPEGKGKPESWESGFERRVVKTTKPEHKEKGYDWRIKGKDRAEVTIKLYRTKPSFAEFKKQMKRVAGHEFGG